MYITINDVIGEKRIDPSYPILSGRKITVVSMLNDNIQYQILKLRLAMDPNSDTKR